MFIELENRVKVVNRYRADIVDVDELHEFVKNLSSTLPSKTVNFGYIVGVDNYSRLIMEDGNVGDLRLNYYRYYYIVLEDGYVSKNLGNMGEHSAKEEFIKHLMQLDKADSYVELNDIIL